MPDVLLHWNTMPRTQDMTAYPVTVHTHGRPVAVLFIGVERNTGMHNYPF